MTILINLDKTNKGTIRFENGDEQEFYLTHKQEERPPKETIDCNGEVKYSPGPVTFIDLRGVIVYEGSPN